MESSEDDAGTATIASRRESARQKDIGPIEDITPTLGCHQDPSEVRVSSEMPAMSEENYDGQSVSSPSAQDVNTSTEAILDMIDEFVDGPGAPKRLQPAPPADCPHTDHDHAAEHEQKSNKNNPHDDTPSDAVLSPATSAKRENVSQESNIVVQTECSSHGEASTEATNTVYNETPQATSSVPEAEENPLLVEDSAASSSEAFGACPTINLPSRSVFETVSNDLDVSECQKQERTVKCVTSSDNRDNVTVESAESTSNDNSVSEVKTVSVPAVIRSPLRRRLVRPAPSDRRPDTTVSSTVDSQSCSIHTTQQTNSESIAKDVSSSSDAVTSVHDNVNDNERRNVSETSVCKAETSVSLHKKIKLNRQKNIPSTSQAQVLPFERQCQPTSSNSTSASTESDCHSSNYISPSESLAIVSGEVSKECASNVSTIEKMGSMDESTSDIPKEHEEEHPLQKLPVLQDDIKQDSNSFNASSLPEVSIDENKTNNVELQSDTNINKESIQDELETTKQVPKLTIKLGVKPPNETKSPIPKLTIKPIKPPEEESSGSNVDSPEKIPSVTKISIKPILRPPEKINDVHRKSSSSEISESEYSENDESTSTSDQASTSDQGSSNKIPKVTIKLGKPGTECEGQLYTEQKVPKLTIKGFQCIENEDMESTSMLKLFRHEEKPLEKIPKLTIKNVTKGEGQPLSPKLTIKPIKPPENVSCIVGQCEIPQIPKIKISAETYSSSGEIKENAHVPKITIKTVTKPDCEVTTKTPRKSTALCDGLENIPIVTRLNIKPVLKPPCESTVESVSEVSKCNLNVEDIPKITKLNIKPLRNPESNSSREKDCSNWNAVSNEENIPIVTKLNIKPIVKPPEDNILKDSDNQSSETGNSSDDNVDHIPAVTKLNIKPIVKPNDLEEPTGSNSSNEESIPIVTKLNIKPLVKPEDNTTPASPKKDNLKGIENKHSDIPVVTRLNIKPIIKPETDLQKPKDLEDLSPKNPPLVMKINMKAVTDTTFSENSQNVGKADNDHLNKEHLFNNISESIPVVPKFTIKPVTKSRNVSSEHIVDKTIQDISINCKSSSHDLSSLKETASQPAEIKCIENSIQEDSNTEEYKNIHQDNKCSNSVEAQTNLDHNATSAEDLLIMKESNSNTNDKLSVTPVLSSILAQVTESVPVNRTQEEMVKNKTTDVTASIVNKTQPQVQFIPVQNCTLLKQLLVSKKDVLEKKEDSIVNAIQSHRDKCSGSESVKSFGAEKINDLSSPLLAKQLTMQELIKQSSENVTKPLEINTSEKGTNQGSGQDSPRIILKINKTEQGSLAKIITEDVKRTDTVEQKQSLTPENDSEHNNDKQKKSIINSRRKPTTEVFPNISMGKRLRSSRVVQDVEKLEKSNIANRNTIKRPSSTETSPPDIKEPELTVLEAKRLKLGQLLSNKSLTITPIVTTSSKAINTSPPKRPVPDLRQGRKTSLSNHTLLNNENCSKNGNSKLHSIISNLQANRLQEMSINLINCSEMKQSISTEMDSNASTGSSDAVEITPIENSHPEVQEMIVQENSEFRDFTIRADEMSQDPLQVDASKTISDVNDIPNIPKQVEMTPQPKKRGRPRKLPVSEGAKPLVTLPTPALEERPQRSLRLSRDRPAILVKPRGRGRGRGAKRAIISQPEPVVIPVVEEPESKPGEIDPTSSRVKLPRMTEALDKMPSICTTPLSSRRRLSSSDAKLFETPELKVVLENTLPKMEDPFIKSLDGESGESRGRGSRGRSSRGGRGRTPRGGRGRGRGRGGGRGAMYMKETMGIYGRVCGPATTTVQLFEEETCMMDDNATPAKPSHLLDEDSQSSVKSSTNESSKMKKSKFADLFDSNKVWTAADVKEYVWPPEKPDAGQQVMMVQEQVAMFLSVKSFKRRYPELKRRTIVGEEKDHVLSKGIVTEALCDLGITAVDASEVLDIMLSDYPHKYEEYRSHQRQKQRTVASSEETVEEIKVEEKIEKVEMKIEPKVVEQKPEPPKIDPEKTRQDMAAAAIASASEWNTRMNALRRRACADLQTLTVLCAKPVSAPSLAAAPPPPTHVCPPAGFYPHALLPGQYQHSYRVYSSDQLRYFPLNTVTAVPAAGPSDGSESEPDWGSCSDSPDSDADTRRHAPKRKKLTKQKRSSQTEAAGNSKEKEKEELKEENVDLCRECKLREEGNRKYSYERFLVCSNCNAKLHPACLDLNADTIRKCREYGWQCAECKTCCGCRLPADDDKMLFCDLCDRGFHIYCVGLDKVPTGRWHCVECAICKSCGARHPSGPSPAPGNSGSSGTPGPLGTSGTAQAEWHHQTRRGPGGHKLYSHSLCTPCARAYRIGRYCPLCERSFIGPKGTMQLVICKLCDRQLHQECVKQTVCSLNVLDYTCGECRRGGITSRAAAVRLAPRTIATLFMAKRRFNKYAHRQYLQSRLAERAAPPPDESCGSDGNECNDPLDGTTDFVD